jgi:nicotinamidase-related amidase
MAPKTLRDVAGLGSQPAALHDSALVLIDCQNTYREGTMKLAGVEAALAEAKRLLERARAAGIPIFHIQHDAGAGSPYDITTRIGQISDEVAPKNGEAVITKHFPNSFVQTDLEQQLRAADVTNVILGG